MRFATKANTAEPRASARPTRIGWAFVLGCLKPHRRALIIANLFLLVVVAGAVSIPLLIPALVDEVLLDRPGWLVSAVSTALPEFAPGPVMTIAAVLEFITIIRVPSTLHL